MLPECPLCRGFILAIRIESGYAFSDIGEVLWDSLDHWFATLEFPAYAQNHVRRARVLEIMGEKSPMCLDLIARGYEVEDVYPARETTDPQIPGPRTSE